jgi:HK97 family phage major capsid protein
MKWIELLKPVGEHPTGKFLEVEDHIARSYIDAGLAKEGGDGPDVVLLQRSIDTFRTELKTFVDSTATAISEAASSVAKRPVIRTGDDTITATEAEADKRAGFGDMVKAIVVNADPGAEPVERAAARDTLTKVYGMAPEPGGMWSLSPSVPLHPRMQREFARSFNRNLAEGAGTTGGYLTQVTYETAIMEVAAEEQVFANRATNVPLGSRQVEWPALDQYTAPIAGQAAWYGGVKVYRKGEASQRTETDPAFKKIVLLANDLTGYTEFSRDLLQDSVVALDAMIPRLLGGAIGWRTDWEIQNGTDLGQFLGIANSPALISVTRGTASHISYADVFSMYVRLLPAEKSYAAWFVHPFGMEDIMKMKDEASRNVYLPAFPGGMMGSISGKPVGTLLGLPVIETEKMATLGTAGDLGLYSMRRYLHGVRAGLEIGLSEHFKWDTDQIAIRAKVRNDGKPQLLSSIYLSDGSGTNKVSAFVSLT